MIPLFCCSFYFFLSHTHRFCVGDRFYLCENKILCEYDYEERLVFANMAYNPSSLAHIRRQVSSLQVRITSIGEKLCNFVSVFFFYLSLVSFFCDRFRSIFVTHLSKKSMSKSVHLMVSPLFLVSTQRA